MLPNPWGPIFLTLAATAWSPMMTGISPDYAWISHYLPFIAAFLTICSIVSFQWPTGTKLTISRPHLFQDKKFINSRHYRVNVQNRGAMTATTVQMNLCGMRCPPKSPAWQADYPYPIIQVGRTLDTNDCRITRDDDAIFEVVHGWANENGMLFVDIDTKSQARNPITIERDEHWELNYTVLAENAARVSFTLELYIENDSVMVRRKK